MTSKYYRTTYWRACLSFSDFQYWSTISWHVMTVTRPSELIGSRQTVLLNQPCVQTLDCFSIIHIKWIQLMGHYSKSLKNKKTKKNYFCSLGTMKSNWTEVLTPLTLQRFLSHMNNLLQTLGWWHPVQHNTWSQGHRSPLHKSTRWVTAPLSLHALARL